MLSRRTIKAPHPNHLGQWIKLQPNYPPGLQIFSINFGHRLDTNNSIVESSYLVAFQK